MRQPRPNYVLFTGRSYIDELAYHGLSSLLHDEPVIKTSIHG